MRYRWPARLTRTWLLKLAHRTASMFGLLSPQPPAVLEGWRRLTSGGVEGDRTAAVRLIMVFLSLQANLVNLANLTPYGVMLGMLGMLGILERTP